MLLIKTSEAALPNATTCFFMYTTQQKGSNKGLKTYSWSLQYGALNILSVSALILYCYFDPNFWLQTIAVMALLLIYLLFLLYSIPAVSATTPKNNFMPQPSEKPKRLVILSTDVCAIHNCSDSTASRKIKLVREFLDKKEHQVVTIAEYCDYWGVDYFETCKFLNLL